MAKILQRYLAFNFITPFIISTTFFIAFLLTFQLFRITRVIINKGVSGETVLTLIGHIAITFLPMAIPLSALFATIYTLNKLSEDSEIVAMRSFGVRKIEMFTPFIILGLVIAATIFSLNRTVIPNSKTQFKNTVIRLTSKGMLTDIRPEHFFTEIPGVTLFAEKVVDKGAQMEEIFLHFKSSGSETERVIFAKSGSLIKQMSGEWDIPSIRLNLRKGNITKLNQEKMEIEKILFDEYDFPVTSSQYQPGFVTRDSMMSNRELLNFVAMKEGEVKALREKLANPEQEAAPIHGQIDGLKKRIAKANLEYWSRWKHSSSMFGFYFDWIFVGNQKGQRKRDETLH